MDRTRERNGNMIAATDGGLALAAHDELQRFVLVITGDEQEGLGAELFDHGDLAGDALIQQVPDSKEVSKT